MTGSWEVLPREQPIPAARRSAERALLEDLVRRSGPQARPRRTRPLVLAGVGLALVSATGAGVAFSQRTPAIDTSIVHCHSTLDLGRAENFAGTAAWLAGEVPTGEPISNSAAVETCAELWAEGILRSGMAEAQAPSAPRGDRVPELTGCVTADGIAAVFPSTSDVCAALGLRALDE